MENSPEKTDSANSKIIKLFGNYYSNARIEATSEDKLTPATIDFFEDRSKRFTNKDDYKPGNFECYFAIQHNSGEHTYVAKQTKTYNTNNDTEQLVYLYDVDETDQFVGYSEIRFNEKRSEYFLNKPFVGFTFTKEKFRKKGLGIRRLRAMNALAKSFFGHSLHSDTLVGERPQRTWKRLINNGEAYEYLEGKQKRFAFK